MILISTLRKMIQKNPAARVVRVTIKAHSITFGSKTIDGVESCEYFATDRQASHYQIEQAHLMRTFGADPSKLIFVDYISANDAAKAQGFDYLGA